MPAVRITRFLVVLLYATYLAYAGSFFLFMPWSELWTVIALRLPSPYGPLLGHPAVRGLFSGFGVLHFIVAALEIAGGLGPRGRT